MNKFSRDLVQGMQEAAAFAEGRQAEARVHTVEVPDVRAIRRRLHRSRDKVVDADLRRHDGETTVTGQ